MKRNPPHSGIKGCSAATIRSTTLAHNPFEGCKWIDLTHDLTAAAPTWEGGCGFKNETLLAYEECPGDVKFLVQHFQMNAGIGTHVDAPAHSIPGGTTIEKIPLASLIVPCILIKNLSHIGDEKYRISVQDIQQFEALHGCIPKGAFVIFFTGWERFWNDPDKYRNGHRFPSISAEAAEYLLHADIAGIGIDTLSPDTPDSGYPVHRLILGAGKYIVENVAHADLLPPKGSFSLALPIKVLQGTEAPARLIACIPKLC